MTAEQLIDALQAKSLLPDTTIAKLRKKIGGSEKPLSAKSLARYLIDKELVTKPQALALLVEGGEVSKGAVRQPEPNASTKPADMPDFGNSPLDELQDLSSSAEWAMEESKFSSAASQALDSEAKSSSKSKKKGKKKASDWDSPVILIGGGLVVAFLLFGATIIYILSSEDTDKILAEARGAMESNNHATAVTNYEKFLEKASGHPERSKARMELAMTRIRQNLALSPQKGLDVAKTELGATANEDDFRQAEEHLSDLLPKIADELAKKAASSEKPEESQQFLAQAKEALGMAFNTKYIPKARRDATQLEGIRETIEVVERRQQALVDQEATLAKIEAANSSGDAGTAFNEYELLLEKHPALLGNQRLAEALEKTAQAELAGIKYTAETVEATATDRESPVKAALGTVSVRQAGQAPVSGMYYVQVAGVLYGVNAADGGVVWRRYVGVKTEPSYPQTIGEGDIVLLESVGSGENSQQELVRMEGATGNVKWRLPLDDHCAEPLVHGERIYLSGNSGKLRVVNAATGQQEGFVQFSQPLASPPAINAEKGVLYVAGEHSSLYSIKLADNSCIGVHYTRHGRGAVKAAPAVVLDKVVVVENDGAQTCKLRAFSLNAQGAIEQGIQDRRLDGRVLRSPLVNGRRVVVLTDRGQISVYDVSVGSEGEALSNQANRAAMGGSPFLRFAAIADRDIWYGENALSKFAVAPAGNRLTIQELVEDYNRSQFVAPLEIRDGVVLHARSRRGHPGFTVTASSVENGKPYWEVDVAAPPAGDPVSSADGKGVLRADANGQTHLFQPTGGGRQFVRLELQGSAPQREFAAYEYSTPLKSGGAIYTRRGDSAAIWQQASGESRVIELPGQLACEPTAFGEGWLAPLSLGQVFYFGGANGTPVAAPFQPPLGAGEGVVWRTPAALGDGQFVITDGVKKLYLVEFDDSNVPQLRATMEGEVGESPVVTPLAAAGEYVYGATRVGQCIPYRIGTLERQAPVDLGAPVLWGPYTAGSLVLFHTAAGQLVAFDGSGQKVWEQAFPHGQIAGTPMTRDDNCLLATDTGSIVTVALADGTLAAATEVDEPLMGGPAQVLGSLVVVATDGTLLVVDAPAESGGRN